MKCIFGAWPTQKCVLLSPPLTLHHPGLHLFSSMFYRNLFSGLQRLFRSLSEEHCIFGTSPAQRSKHVHLFLSFFPSHPALPFFLSPVRKNSSHTQTAQLSAAGMQTLSWEDGAVPSWNRHYKLLVNLTGNFKSLPFPSYILTFCLRAWSCTDRDRHSKFTSYTTNAFDIIGLCVKVSCCPYW